jgi:hypothetical protein
MFTSRLIAPTRRSVLTCCTCVLALATISSPAPAAESAPVTVRVEGLTETRVLPTPVTLAGTPLVKDGNPEHSCPAHSALAALDLATGGNWGGPWSAKFKQYELFTVEGETHLFEPESKANYFWWFWLNEKESLAGACEALLNPGDRVLFVVGCFGEACPQPEPLPLGIEAPSSANVSEPVEVTVKRFSTAGAGTETAGATIGGAASPAMTDAHGHAVVTFTQPGTATLRVTAPQSIRTEAVICVHNGNDGNCGTHGPTPSVSTATKTTSQTGPPPPYKGPYAIVARPVDLLDGHVYLRRNAPRVLAGLATAHTGVSSLSIELWREYRGRCYAYDGTRERFMHARCAHGSFFKIPGRSSFFKVSSTSRFSYLLPFSLGRGEYVLDIDATDVAGNRTTLARGTSRIRFYVR